MSALRESPDHARQLLAAIGRELARASKRRRTYLAARLTVPAARLTRRMRMLERLRDDAAAQVDPTARIIDDDEAIAPGHDVVYPIESAQAVPNGAPRRALASIEFPAMTADALDEDDLLDGLV